MKSLRACFLSVLIVAALLGAAPVGATSLNRGQTQDQIVHTVQPGENLFRIALRYSTSVDAIVAANGLGSSHTIYVGQQLIIPRSASNPPEPVALPTNTDSAYVVQWGDTLSAIARRYGVTTEALMQANGLFSPHTIYAGQRLVISGTLTPTSEVLTLVNGAQTSPSLGDTYVVRSGDTLSQIARQFGLSLTALARLNGITNPALIHPGQVLRLSDAAPFDQAHGMPLSSNGDKRIEVNLSQQHLYAYEGERLVYSFVASSGVASSPTRSGEFRVQSKLPRAYGSAWGIWMPYWLGIYWAGPVENGIHALPVLSNGQTLWAGYLGRPVSYGCIVLGTFEAQLLYEWAEIGTPVSIGY
ncbi:MAG: LysM peptidoglycan-binding domain-containing protein [Anaerolineae bacterium]|jgi:LysM repeat protein